MKDKIRQIKYSRLTPKEMMKCIIFDDVKIVEENGFFYYTKNSKKLFYFTKFLFNDYGSIVFSTELFYNLSQKLRLNSYETESLIWKTISRYLKIHITEFSLKDI